MITRLLLGGLLTLAACSGGTPAETPAIPSTILLPAETDPSPSVMVLGELTGLALNHGNTWVAVAQVTVLDGGQEPVAGALVTGEWNEGDADTDACTTDETGTCELESGSMKKRVLQATLEITDVSHESLSYDPDLDDSPDRNWDLTIRKP